MKNQILKVLLNIMLVIATFAVGIAVTIPFLYAGYLIEGQNLPLVLEALIEIPLLFVFTVALAGSLVYGVGGLSRKLYRELFGESAKS